MKYIYKQNRGFTLVELLAVILVLSFISLIAIPTISGLVNNAKKSATQRSAEMYLKSVNSFISLSKIDSSIELLSDNIYTVANLKERGVKLENTLPKSGKVTISNGKVSRMDINIENYDVLFENEKYSVSDHKENLLSVTDCNFTFDGMESRDIRNDCLKGTIKAGKKYQMIFDLYLNIEDIKKNDNGSLRQQDFWVRNHQKFKEDGIVRFLNRPIGEYNVKVNKKLTANDNFTNTFLTQIDAQSCKGYGTISNARLYEVK